MQVTLPETKEVGQVYEVVDQFGDIVGYGTDIWDMTTIYWIGEDEDPEVARIACEELAHAYAGLL